MYMYLPTNHHQERVPAEESPSSPIWPSGRPVAPEERLRGNEGDKKGILPNGHRVHFGRHDLRKNRRVESGDEDEGRQARRSAADFCRGMEVGWAGGEEGDSSTDRQ